jgi:hypothetical protein
MRPRVGWSYFFRNCPNLVSVTVDADHPTYRQSGGALYNRDLTSLEYVPTWRTGRYEVPEGVLRIADDAMGSCSKLTEVQLPETLQTIGSGAFFDCAQLQRIRIPDSVTRLGSFAFYNCSQLVEVVMGAGIQNIEESTFAGSGLKRISFGPLVSVIHADVLPDFAEGWGTSPLELYFHGNAPAVVGDMRPAGLAKLFYAGGTLGWTSDFHGIPATEWQVSVRAELATSPHDDFQMRTIVDGPAGMSCVVEAAENLSTPTWTRVGLVTLPTGGTSVFVDPDAARHSNRFYRVRMP